MRDYRLDKLRGIKKEVEDFHPLLRVLFSRLEGVTEVEYRQGPSEMGADFVLTKKDITLGGQEYVGVVVKIGQITQSHAEVERQIEECELERTFNSGKKKVYLSEIWVVASGSITQNAQEKIHHKYRSKKIKFIDIDALLRLVDAHYPEYWDDVPVQEGEYLKVVRDNAHKLTYSNGMGFSFSDESYIPQSLVKIDNSKSIYKVRRKNKKQRLFLSEALEKESLVLVEAMMGTGKTTLLSKEAAYFSSNEVYIKNKTLPIFVTAKQFHEVISKENIDIIEWTLREYSLSSQDRYLVLIDALDEMAVNGAERLSFIRSVRECFGSRDDVKVVITSRSFDDPDVEAEIDGLFSRYMLCSLTVPQVVGLVKAVCKNSGVVERLEKDLEKSLVFKALPKTPISAILLARILQENVQEIPSTMTDLYAKYMELVLGRWDVQKGLQSQIEYDVINNVVTNIATFMLENQLIEVPLGDIREIYESYVGNRKFDIDKDMVYEKMLGKKEVFSVFSERGVLTFRHRTFAEYFYAQGLSRDQKAIIDENVYELYWAASYFFYFGMKRDCPDLVASLDNVLLSDDRSRLLKLLGHGNVLLAAYLTPYDVVAKSMTEAFSDAAKLYIDLTEMKVESPLQQFSKIQLLSIFTHCLCNGYGYNYFVDGLRDRALELYSSPSMEGQDFVELFLINSVLVHNKDKHAYDHMIEEYGRVIPLELQAAILEHSDEKNSYTSLSEKFSKRFMRGARKNKNIHRALMDIYETPIKDSKVLKG